MGEVHHVDGSSNKGVDVRSNLEGDVVKTIAKG